MKAIVRVKKYIHENNLEFKPDWKDRDQRKYYIYYNNLDNEFEWDASSYDKRGDALFYYFKSSQDSRKVITNCKEDLKIIYDVK